MLVKIGDVAEKYNISNRTLRYWEDEGILSSLRMENGYRYYNDENLTRIKQILMLRKLRLPIQDIQSIFVSNELSAAIGALQLHLERTKHETEELEALGIVLEKLIGYLRKKNSLSEVWGLLEVQVNEAAFELKNALQIMLSERDYKMSENKAFSKIGDVRIVKLPKMIFACYRAESTAPEDDCWKVVNKLILENSLHEKLGFRHFGFNNPDPSQGNPVYGYEMWTVVPEDFKVQEPFYRKEFKGGLFASISTQMPLIGERWKLLSDWINNNDKYEVDWNPEADRRCLEECIDYLQFTSEDADFSELQLDLLTPVKRK